MLVTGLSLNAFEAITIHVSATQYAGNVTVADDAHALSANRFRARLKVRDSHAHGARTSWNGRHTPAASWEAYRDVLTELFDQFPNARVQTAMATYRGRDGFRATYPGTAYVNVGSMMQPATMPDLTV